MRSALLTPEQARVELERVAVANPAGRRLRRSLLLSGAANDVVRIFSEDGWRPRAEAGVLLDDLPERSRRRAFRALHPGLAEVLDGAWSALSAQPYTRGYTRRGFRVPTNPELTARERAEWLYHLLALTEAYDKKPPSWFAAWAGRMLYGFGGETIGRLLGVAIDQGDQAVYDVLLATVRGEHDVALMGRHVPVALLSCSNPDAWQQIERLLLSARRQEGLRQSILESVDLAHPQAFRRMLRLLLEHELTRFASTVRAVGVWLGEPFDVTDRKLIDRLLADLVELLEDASVRTAALAGDDPGQVYLALWATAFDDAVAAVQAAKPVLSHESADHRLAAARLLAAIQLPVAGNALLAVLDDSDPRVVAAAVHGQSSTCDYGDAVFSALCALVKRIPKRAEVEIGLWKPQQLALNPADIADNLAHGLGRRPPIFLADVVHRMSASGRELYAAALANDAGRYREDLLALVGDRAGSVRRRAMQALADGPAPSVEEAAELESLLSKRGADLRRGVLTLLLRQDDLRAAESAQRLIEGAAMQAEAGRELAGELRSANRATDALGQPDTEDVSASTESPVDLIDHSARTPVERPTKGKPTPIALHNGARLILTSLDAWLSEHRDVEVKVTNWNGPGIELLSNLRWLRGPASDQEWTAQREHQPLREITDPWWERTSAQLSDDRRELGLAWAALEGCANTSDASIAVVPAWERRVLNFSGQLEIVRRLLFTPIMDGILAWYVVREAQPGWITPLLDEAENALADVPAAEIRKLRRVAEDDPPWHSRSAARYVWRGQGGVCGWASAATKLEALRPDLWTAAERGRLWRLLRFLDEPQGTYNPASGGRETTSLDPYERVTREVPRRPARYDPPLRLAARAVDDSVATRADVLELLVGERVLHDRSFHPDNPLGDLTRRNKPAWVARHPWLGDLADEIRGRTVDAEAERGELPTPYSELAHRLRSIEGVDVAARLMAALGKQKLVRGYVWGSGDSKAATLSRLIRLSFPLSGETADQLAAATKRNRLSDRQLRDLAVYAPQWASLVESALGEPGLTDAVHWLHAHTKDDQWSVDEDVRDEWTSATHERTELQHEDLFQGAVDISWLNRVLETLGDERFDRLLNAAKYASSAGGHKRAELFAQAARGRVDRGELITRINDKRHQDSVRALGLLPLPAAPDTTRDEVLARYRLLQQWREQSKKFGQQRRASEDRAVRIGMENLARTAGYRDPQRLTWAMEAEAVRDLAAGPVTATDGDLSVTLSVDEHGKPQMDVRRGDRTLKAIPKTSAKNEQIAELKRRVQELRGQARRMRVSLEDAVVRGDPFTTDELSDLMAHPVLAPQLSTLVLVSDEGLHGFPRGHGRTLAGHDGVERAVDGSPLRIAHPVDLLATDEWSQWQHACFTTRIRQPFKQVFRELYVPTVAERDGATESARYAGHQVNPRQAIALLGNRRWIVDREAGAMRTFHDERLTARLTVLEGAFTPAEVEGMTIESVSFTPVGEWIPVPLESVPPRLFSEVMRDIDLVVSVAHAGGVDPEASASTAEMRGSLVRETAELLDLQNVELTDHHALVQGKLGTYSIHLGSGVVHRRPGNALCIVPVGAQHRGRLFLPFVDDDPRTAEVVSKVVLLARDDKIRDPTILEQLR